MMSRSIGKKHVVLIILFFLCACGQRSIVAPVEELNWRARHYAARHVVVRGETLYAIAFRYDRDYRQLAQMNHLSRPYTLHVGQVIQLNPNGARATRRSRIRTTRYVPQARPVMVPSKSRSGRWLWPVQGRVVANYAPQLGRKGIDIAGEKGSKIRASSSGVVAYAGSGLSGYGNLIIIKHDKQFMTAYGNNARNLVKEGQFVKAGQVIGDVGVVDQRYWGVHFEIRYAGKPLNPRIYL